MKERPILFSGPMVLAILEGRKTQTRRIVKRTDSGRVKAVGSHRNYHLDDQNAVMACPYGKPGDLMWVRERWAAPLELDQTAPRNLPTDTKIWHHADGHQDWELQPGGFLIGKWRPSIHMPRWASRIMLEIVAVRVERLQDISCEDAKAEGFHPGLNGLERWNGKSYGNSRLAFEACWKDINGPGSWEKNPFVWCIEFRRI